jgi:hypothetical protein
MHSTISLSKVLQTEIQFQNDTLALKQGGQEHKIFVLSLLVTNKIQRLKNYSPLSAPKCKQN